MSSPPPSTLLITSASGKQATALLPLLAPLPTLSLRLAVHTTPSKHHLETLHPTAQVLQTDLTSPSALPALLTGITTLLYIAPTYHPHELAIGTALIATALKTPGFAHFVYSSVLHPLLDGMPHHAAKRGVEKALVESGLRYTILQPTTFMDNLPIAAIAKMREPRFAATWGVENPFSWVATGDLAQAMKTVVLGGERHFGATYQIVGTRRPLSFGEAMGIVERKIGREVRVEVKKGREAVDALLVRLFGTVEGIDPRTVELARGMVEYYDKRGIVGNSNVLEWLIGRDAMQFDEWVDGKLAELEGAN
ncbi:NAD(P)-binding protein [Karstenula rhodostoma CBS 690.94]|uniref:NAD(P)-binding protein n=1 Tax=Karstenula rhodostoma CBS 690.94 TaxID=1392251 RepID=A0A9P4PTZ1_9PLEO|nr:NAD(P)-binding protein [Karstenula rhodostoma CBS 690.94]